MQNIFIDVLPPWVETGLQPAFYDLESGTVLQQTARMWAKMREMGVAFNTFTEDVTETVNRFIDEFHELYTYVHDYFDNLDVQEEINHKLDIMAEDGTLANILNEIIISEIRFKYLQRVTPNNSLYDGHVHNFMQGFCYVDGKIVACFINQSYADNYVRLAEINIENGSIIRQAYLELNHANAISYSAKDNKLYVASCAKMVDGVYTYDNTIFAVDYATFELIDTINVVNIPEGHRIRSVWYDNETDTLYGGDVYDMFVIDEATETITETVELEQTYIDKTATNQTLKKFGRYYVGCYLSFIVYWDIYTKKTIKIQPVNIIQDDEYIGELEDIAVDENGNIIIGCTNYDTPRLADRNASFYISNPHYNVGKAFTPFGATTTSKNIYVDPSNITGYEDGTTEHPFISLQRAINYSMIRDNLNTRINIAEGSYPYTYVHGVRNCDFNITGDVTIDGLEILNSDLVIESTSDDNTVVINGISAKFSSFKNIRPITINKFTRNDVTGSTYNFYSYFATVELLNCTFTGNNDHTLIKADRHSDMSLYSCEFSDYDGYYAVDADWCSVVYTYELTLNKEISSSDRNFKIQGGSRFFTRNALLDENNFDILSQAMKYPTMSEGTILHHFSGDCCVIDPHFNAVILTIKKAGATNDHVTVTSRIEDLDHLVVDTVMLSGSTRIYGCIEFRYDDTTNMLKINFSRRCVYTYSDNSNVYRSNTSDTPESETDWCSVTKVAFIQI